MVRFPVPKTAEILQFLDPEIVKMHKKNHGCGNRRNGVISGSRNCRKGRQILYEKNSYWAESNSNFFEMVMLSPDTLDTVKEYLL